MTAWKSLWLSTLHPPRTSFATAWANVCFRLSASQVVTAGCSLVTSEVGKEVGESAASSGAFDGVASEALLGVSSSGVVDMCLPPCGPFGDGRSDSCRRLTTSQAPPAAKHDGR